MPFLPKGLPQSHQQESTVLEKKISSFLSVFIQCHETGTEGLYHIGIQ